MDKQELMVKSPFILTDAEIEERLGLHLADIEELTAKYMKLTVSGVDDTEGYKAVHAARMDVVHYRTGVTKSGLADRKGANDYCKSVIRIEKRLATAIAPIEEYLISQEMIRDDEIARIKAEAEEKEAARIQERVSRLFALGCTFNGQNYFLPYAPKGYTCPNAIIKAANDEQFTAILSEFQKLVAAENQRLDDEKAAKLAEEERIKDEQRKLTIRQGIQTLREVIVLPTMSAHDTEKFIENYKENEPRDGYQEFQAEAMDTYQKTLANLVVIYDHKIKQEAESRRLDAIVKEQAEREAKIKADQEKIEKEKKRLIDEEAARLAKIESDKQLMMDEQRHAAQIEEAKRATAERIIREAKEKEEREAAEKVEKERLAKIEAERLELIKPDKDKLLAFADSIDLLRLPELKDEQANAVLALAKKTLAGVSNNVRKHAREL